MTKKALLTYWSFVTYAFLSLLSSMYLVSICCPTCTYQVCAPSSRYIYMNIKCAFCLTLFPAVVGIAIKDSNIPYYNSVRHHYTGQYYISSLSISSNLIAVATNLVAPGWVISPLWPGMRSCWVISTTIAVLAELHGEWLRCARFDLKIVKVPLHTHPNSFWLAMHVSCNAISLRLLQGRTGFSNRQWQKI